MVVECDMLCERGAAWRTVSSERAGAEAGATVGEKCGKKDCEQL